MRLHFILLAFLPLAISAQNIIHNSEIESVTVYRSGAVVERTAIYNGPAGKQVLRIDNLPDNLNSEAIQAHVPEGWRLLKTDYRTLRQDERELPELAILSATLKKANDAIEAEKDILTSLVEDLGFLGANSDLGEGVSAQQLRATDEYLARRRRVVRTAIRQSKTNIETLQKEARAARAKLTEAEQSTLKQETSLFIEVDIKRNARQAFTIAYFTPAAEWTPFYNVRSSGNGEPVEIEFMAGIRQSSGEDWTSVDLRLSTGNPSIGADEPDLPPWYLSFSPDYVPTRVSRFPGSGVATTFTYSGLVVDAETGEALPYASVELRSNNFQQTGISDIDGRFNLGRIPDGRYSLTVLSLGYENYTTSVYINPTTPPQKIPLLRAAVELEEVVITGGTPAQYGNTQVVDGYAIRGSRDSRTAVTMPSKAAGEFNFERTEQVVSTEYHIDEPFTVPSSGEEQEAWISTHNVPAEYVYRIRPARAEEAFLIAHLSDWEALGLIAAKAHLFLDGTYNGESIINPSEAGDTLSISMGMDPGITIKRKRVNPRKSKRFLSSNIREDFTYEIDVRNTKSVPVRVEIQDQYPISRVSEIVVERKDHGNGAVDNETGIISWDRSIEPGSSAVIRFSFEVKYPKGRSVNLPN